MNPLRITYRHAAVALALLTIAAALLGPAAGHAEEKGMTITLSYVRGYSNWGPTNVYGNAQFWPSEGVAALYVHNLPRLLQGDTYASWIVNTASGDVRRLGTFNTDDAGDGYEDITFDGGLPPGSNALLVTVQHPGDPATGPGPQRSLAGYFPTGQGHNAAPSQPANPGTVATPPTPTVPPQNANHPTQPRQPGHTGSTGSAGSAGSSGSKESAGTAGAGGNSARAHGVKALPTTGHPCPACIESLLLPNESRWEVSQ